MAATHTPDQPAPRRAARALGVLAALIAGGALVAVFVSLREQPARLDTAAPPTVARYVEARPLPFRVQARGFGEVTPARHWLAVASVEGKIVHRHPQLEDGAILPAGALLAEIDPGRYRLAIAEAEAEAATLAAERAQLQQDADNTRELLALERQRLTLAETELARIRKLAAGGSVTASRADEQLRATLAQRQAVKSLENRLLLLPSQSDRLDAQLERVATRLSQARRDLADTRIVAPFDMRVSEVRIEQDQHVGRGQQMLAGDAIDTAEVVLQVPLSAMRGLLATLGEGADAHTAQSRQAPAIAADAAQLPALAHYPDLATIDAELRLASNSAVRWPARVARSASRVDPVTRTIQIVLSVDEPYRSAEPPQRPPLVTGMYVEGVLSTTTAEPRIVVPAAALHGDMLHIADSDDRLVRRAVTPTLRQRDLVVIEAGVEAGERVIIDDIVPAITGMALSLQHDDAAQTRLARVAAGAAQ